MKTSLISISAISLVFSVTSAQNCLPFSHTHSGRICYGYAMGIAGGKAEGDQTCDPLTLNAGGIDGLYFQQYDWSERDSVGHQLASGDILYWPGTHAAYVVSDGRDPYTHIVNVNNITVQHTAAGKDTVWYDDPLPSARYRLDGNDIGLPGYFCKRKNVSITVRNSFNGGDVKVNGLTDTSGAPRSVPWWRGVPLEARSQDYHNVLWVWNYWDQYSTNNPYYVLAISGDSHMAHFNPFCDMHFDNSMPGTSGSRVTVWDTLRIAPITVRMPQGTIFHAIARDTSINSISYTFTHWDDGPTSRDRQDTANQHRSFTAVFAAKPNAVTNLEQRASVGQNVRLTWDNNTNTVVDVVNIYRHEAGPNPRVQVGTVGREGEWTDQDVIVKGPKDGPEFVYDVACTFTGASESDYVSINQFGEYCGEKVSALLAEKELLSAPIDFSVGSYPNPFNPSTTIAFAIPTNSSVKLEIYDVAGRKVRSLVDDYKSAGAFNAIWDGKDEAGRTVLSGAYFYRFTASPLSGEKPFLQSGKLILAK